MPLVRSEFASANLKLGDLELTASRFAVGGPKPLSAQIDTNNFNLANLSPMIPPSAGYGLAGMSEIHARRWTTAGQSSMRPAHIESGIAELVMALLTLRLGPEDRR